MSRHLPSSGGAASCCRKGNVDEYFIEKQGNIGLEREQHGDQRLFVNGRV